MLWMILGSLSGLIILIFSGLQLWFYLINKNE